MHNTHIDPRIHHRLERGGNILARSSDVCVLQHLVSGNYLGMDDGTAVLSANLTESMCMWSLHAHGGSNLVSYVVHVGERGELCCARGRTW